MSALSASGIEQTEVATLKVSCEREAEVNILTSPKLNIEEMAIQFSTNCLGNDPIF